VIQNRTPGKLLKTFPLKLANIQTFTTSKALKSIKILRCFNSSLFVSQVSFRISSTTNTTRQKALGISTTTPHSLVFLLSLFP
jgi:hypothetical protein